MSMATRTVAAALPLFATAFCACAPSAGAIVGEWALDATATLAQSTQAPRSEAARDAVTTMRFRYHFEADGTVGVSFRHGMQYWARTGLWSAESGTSYRVAPGDGGAGWSAYTVTIRDGALYVPAPHEEASTVVLAKR